MPSPLLSGSLPVSHNSVKQSLLYQSFTFWRRSAPLIGLLGIVLLTSCAQQQQAAVPDQSKEAEVYREHTKNYAPPGPPEDPWGPYIGEAATRFDVPERWIREVMRVESGGHEIGADGLPITSPVGAMGLMQVMPETYDGLKERYGLAEDPYDPHNSILAGTAYIREMYDVYGSPGFLAAYNAGPSRLDDYLNRSRMLPAETRRYVAMIGPYIRDSYPVRRSVADDQPSSMSFDSPLVTRVATRAAPTRVQFARATRTIVGGRGPHLPVEVAALPEPRRHGAPGFHLIPAAMAESLPTRRGGPANGTWAIQVGAYGNETLARNAVGSARGRVGAAAHSKVATVQQGRATLYRARLTGLSRDAAVHACERLSHGKGGCTVISPNAQS